MRLQGLSEHVVKERSGVEAGWRSGRRPENRVIVEKLK